MFCRYSSFDPIFLQKLSLPSQGTISGVVFYNLGLQRPLKLVMGSGSALSLGSGNTDEKRPRQRRGSTPLQKPRSNFYDVQGSPDFP